MYQDRLQASLVPAFQAAFKSVYSADIEADKVLLQTTRPEFDGDVTINVFPFLKQSGKGPEPTAQALGEKLLAELDIVAGFNVIKGFLNLVIADSYWLGHLADTVSDGGLTFPSTGRQLMVEYSSPNTNKPLHLGHLRNNFLGHSVSRILAAVGNEVVRVQVINDRGIHICKSMIAWQKFGGGETPQTSGLKGDKLVGKYYVAFDKEMKRQVEELVSGGMDREKAEKEVPILQEAQEMLRQWEAGDPDVRALWAEMNGWVYAGFNATYARMGVEFDQLYYESNTYTLGRSEVLAGVEKGVFYRKNDGSVWCDLSDEGLDEKLLLRSDGTAVYMTQDIGTAIQRFVEYPELSGMVYTVGNEQDHHFKVLFLILKKLGYTWASELYHLSYGMVDLPSGKMKSREGTVVDADDLMQEVVDAARATTEELGKLDDFTEAERTVLFEQIGLAALKYFLLKVDPKKRMLFDPAASIDMNGHTGPFIQYTYARTQSLLRKADSPVGAEDLRNLDTPEFTLLPEERAVLKLLHQYPTVLHAAAQGYDPSGLANHAYEVVKAYNSFYQTVPVLKEADTDKLRFRLGLSSAVAATTKKAMWCLGIAVPERM